MVTLPVVKDRTLREFYKKASLSRMRDLIDLDMYNRDNALYNLLSNISDMDEHNRLSLGTGGFIWGLLNEEGEVPKIGDGTGLDSVDISVYKRLKQENPNVYDFLDHQCKVNEKGNKNSIYVALGGIITYSLLEQQTLE